MSRLPLTPTGLAPLNPPTIIDNPFVEDDLESPAESIAAFAQTEQAQSPEIQEALGRALFATQFTPAPQSTRQQQEILRQEQIERARIARAAADPDEPLSQEAINALTQQHNQRWSTYAFIHEMPSPVSIYAQKAAEDDPAVRRQMISEGLREYQRTGELNDNVMKVLGSEQRGDREFVEKRMSAIDKSRIDKTNAIGDTLIEIVKAETPEGRRALYAQLRLKYPDLPAAPAEATLADYEYLLAGRQLGLPAPQPEQPGFLRRFAGNLVEGLTGPLPGTPGARPAPNFQGEPADVGAVDIRRMSDVELSAFIDMVKQSGVPRVYIGRDGSRKVLDPSKL